MRKQIGKNEIKGYDFAKFGYSIDKKSQYSLVDGILIFENNDPIFFLKEGRLVPTLKSLVKNNILKQIVVDMGAVKFVVSGADIMRPGIKEFPDFDKGEIVSIVDINNKKPIAVGLTMFSSDDIRLMQTGKVIRNLHYVGDKIWQQ